MVYTETKIAILWVSLWVGVGVGKKGNPWTDQTFCLCVCVCLLSNTHLKYALYVSYCINGIFQKHLLYFSLDRIIKISVTI